MLAGIQALGNILFGALRHGGRALRGELSQVARAAVMNLSALK